MDKKQVFKWVLLILLLGGFFRFHGLGDQPIWFDESYTLQNIDTNSTKKVIEQTAKNEGTPPLYFIGLYHWTNIFGKSPGALRTPSVLFGCLSLIIIFMIANRLYDKKAGLFAMALMAFSMANVMLSQEARAYSLFIFLSLLSTYFYIRYLLDGKGAIDYSISLFIMLWAHYFAFIVIGLQTFIYFCYHDEFKAKIIGFSEAVLVSTITWAVTCPVWLVQIPYIINVLGIAISDKFGLHSIARIWHYLFIMGFLGGGLLLIYLHRKHGLLNKFSFIFSKQMLQVVVGGYFIIAIFLGYFLNHPTFYVRYTVFLFPIFYVWFAIMLARVKKHNYIPVIIISLLSIGLLFGFYYSVEDRKEQWDDVATHIWDNQEEREIIFILSPETRHLFKQYYGEGLPMLSAESTSNMTENERMWNTTYLLTRGMDGVWYVSSHNYRPKGFWFNNFKENYNLTYAEQYTGIALFHFEVNHE